MKKSQFLVFVFLVSSFFLLNLTAFGQAEDDVIINEFVVNPAAAAGKEYVELLVVNPAGVNMMGWTLSDVATRAGATGATEGDVTLNNAVFGSTIPRGTYVVIVFTTPTGNADTLAEDVSLADGNNRLVLLVGTTANIVAGGTIDNATNDNLHLYAGTRAAGTLIDEVLAGTNTSYITGATWGDNNGTTTTDNVNGGTAIPAGAAVAFTPPSFTTAELQNNDTGARFTVTPTSYGSPGATNFSASAAQATIGGQVKTADGMGISKARVTLSGGSLSSPLTVLTNSFGYYQFDGIPTGDTYILSVSSKGKTFQNPTRVVSVQDNLASEDFISNESGGIKGGGFKREKF